MNGTVSGSVSTSALANPLVRLMVLIVFLVFLSAGFLSYGVWRALSSEPAPASTKLMSVAQLEERHGLAVELIRVIAGGGMVDLRVKILDVEKARKSLEEPANMPRLIVADSGETLMVVEGFDNDVNWRGGRKLFVPFSNNGDPIQPGTEVVLEFGDGQLGPIPAQ